MRISVINDHFIAQQYDNRVTSFSLLSLFLLIKHIDKFKFVLNKKNSNFKYSLNNEIDNNTSRMYIQILNILLKNNLDLVYKFYCLL